METGTLAPSRLLSSSAAGVVAPMAAVTGSTIAATVTVSVVAGPPVTSAEVSTVTLILASLSKSLRSKARVSVATVSLVRTTAVMVVPTGAPMSVKSPVTRITS